MIGYAARAIFSSAELRLQERATTLVAIAPDKLYGELVRCHELARAVGKVLGLTHEDGRYGFVEHTWLWTTPRQGDRLRGPWDLPNVLDVYVPGCMPQVQLVHMQASGLPTRYFLSPVFDVVIRDAVVDALVEMFGEGKIT